MFLHKDKQLCFIDNYFVVQLDKQKQTIFYDQQIWLNPT